MKTRKMKEKILTRCRKQTMSNERKKMEEQFVSQNLKPGDDGFVYDKQIEFPEPQMESGWDSNQEDSDLEF